MKTPICTFVSQYLASDPVRLHMPGHKGHVLSGPEARDITEIEGADVLYDAHGIIAESEANAAALFGTFRTFYSCEGSSLCIRAMLMLALLDAQRDKRGNTVIAARNAHRVFLSAAALLDFPIVWLYPDTDDNRGVLSCTVTPAQLENVLASQEVPPAAVYLTSPDYLGNIADIRALSAVCHRHGTILLCDNAHGAYTHFLADSLHPADLGADLCCDSAHKTLPALTGAAYLHIAKNARHAAFFAENAQRALSMFASTSPSYLILQSLDRVNVCLSEAYREKLDASVRMLAGFREQLHACGYETVGDEPLKLTIAPKPRGYTGAELGRILYDANLIPEFYDPDFLTLMVTPETPPDACFRVTELLASLPVRKPITDVPPPPRPARAVYTPRQAMLAPAVTLPVRQCKNRILASPGVSCPPAVPIVVCGEEITKEAIERFLYYGIDDCVVMQDAHIGSCGNGWQDNTVL